MTEETQPKLMPMVVGNLNTLVIEYPIDIAIQTFYDLSLEDSWDDKCILWTVEDDGEKYKKEVLLTDSNFIIKEEMNIKIQFEKVPTHHKYSCVIDQGDGKSISLFQNLFITEDMAYTKEA